MKKIFFATLVWSYCSKNLNTKKKKVKKASRFFSKEVLILLGLGAGALTFYLFLRGKKSTAASENSNNAGIIENAGSSISSNYEPPVNNNYVREKPDNYQPNPLVNSAPENIYRKEIEDKKIEKFIKKLDKILEKNSLGTQDIKEPESIKVPINLVIPKIKPIFGLKDLEKKEKILQALEDTSRFISSKSYNYQDKVSKNILEILAILKSGFDWEEIYHKTGKTIREEILQTFGDCWEKDPNVFIFRGEINAFREIIVDDLSFSEYDFSWFKSDEYGNKAIFWAIVNCNYKAFELFKHTLVGKDKLKILKQICLFGKKMDALSLLGDLSTISMSNADKIECLVFSLGNKSLPHLFIELLEKESFPLELLKKSAEYKGKPISFFAISKENLEAVKFMLNKKIFKPQEFWDKDSKETYLELVEKQKNFRLLEMLENSDEDLRDCQDDKY